MKKLGLLLSITAAVVFTGNATSYADDIIIDFDDLDTIVRTSSVDTVVDLSGNIYTYNYTVINTSDNYIVQGEGDWHVGPLIVDYEVPLNSPNDVFNILNPDGSWEHEFLSYADYANPFGAPYVLHWFDAEFGDQVPSKAIAPAGYQGVGNVFDTSTDGFIFQSLIGPVNGPYLTSWALSFQNIGDPPLPGGSVGGGGTPSFTPVFAPVPEPSTMLLLGTGLVGVAGAARRRKKKQA